MRHPIESLLRHHAHFGTIPTADELDELLLSPRRRAALLDAAIEAKRLRAEGSGRDADAHAHEFAVGLIADLPAGQRDPRHTHRDPLADVTDPLELAAAIPRY